MGNSGDWVIAAGSVQNEESVGGTLLIAEDALIFAPSGLSLAADKLLRLFLKKRAPVQARVLPLADIAEVGKLEGKLSLKGLSAASAWDRLLITMKNGDKEIFVVDDLPNAIRHISEQLPG